MRLHPGLCVLRRSSESIQISSGIDPRTTLTGLTPQEIELIEELEKGLSVNQFKRRFTSLKISEERAQEILSELKPFLLSNREFYPAAPEVIYLLNRVGKTGSKIWKNRQELSIYINRLDNIGYRIGIDLAQSGIGRIISPDDSIRCARGDNAIGVLKQLPANASLAQEIAWRELPTKVDPQGFPDLAVNISRGAYDPTFAYAIDQENIPILTIVNQGDSASVGPLILPQQTPCLNCWGIKQSEENPSWVFLATQLLSKNYINCDSALAARAASEAVSQIISFYEKTAPTNPEIIYLSADGSRESQELLPAAECGCGGFPSYSSEFGPSFTSASPSESAPGCRPDAYPKEPSKMAASSVSASSDF